MSEEEIINVLTNLFFDEYEWFLRGYDTQTKEEDKETIENAIEGLLDLYQKEKEKNEKLNKYITDKVKTGKEIQTFINKGYVEQTYVSKDKIIEELTALDNMKVDGEVFTTAVNFAKKILQDILQERN